LIVNQEQKMERIHQVSPLAQQALPLAQGLPHQAELPVLQIAQATMDDSGGAAGGARSEIVLFHQQRAFAGSRTFSGHGNAVNTTADYRHMEMLPV
jgi:hypothetical protein